MANAATERVNCEPQFLVYFMFKMVQKLLRISSSMIVQH